MTSRFWAASGNGLWPGFPSGSVVYDADAQTYFTAMTAQPDATRKGHLNTLIAGLKTDGVWAVLDWLMLFASHDAQSALLNAKTPAKTGIEQNAPTFTADLGYTGNGTTSYIDFNEALNAGGNGFAQNSATAGAWCNQGAASGNVPHIGTVTSRLLVHARTTAGNETFTISDSTTDTLQANTGSKLGHRTASRTAAGVKRGFVNGVRTADLTTASAAVATGNGTALRGVSVYSADRLAAVYTGSGFTDAEVASMHTRLNTYLTAIGAN